MVRFRVLGGLEARGEDDRPISLGGPRQRAVVAVLLGARGETVPTDRLVEDVWDGAPPPRALGALQAYVSNLRRALEPDRPPRAPATTLTTRPGGYAIDLPDRAVDAWEFEDLARRAATVTELQGALALWRGPAYPEFAASSWAIPETARLDEVHVALRERLAAGYLSAATADRAVLLAQELTREHPLREEGWRLLALALHATGRRAEALARIRTARALFAEELGLDPGPALSAVESRILDGTLAGDGSPTPARAVASRGAAVFVGRDAELETLMRAADEPGALAVIGGEAGSGKSALLDRFRSRLDDAGRLTAVGRCPEFDGAPSAWAWVEILREIRHTVAPGSAAASLAPLLELGGAPPPGVPAADASVGRFLLHHAVGDYLETALSHRPTALILDDLHRADAETLALLTHVAERRLPLLVAVAYRADEPGSRIETALADLARFSPTRVRLGGLDVDSAATLIRRVAGRATDPATVAALTERTGGNPFYLQESARLLAAEGELVATSEVPDGVRDVLRRRIAQLPEASASVLRLASVVGREVPVDLLTAASDLDENAVLDAVEDGLGARLVTEPEPGIVRFGHALVRETLYSDLSRLRRHRWHERVAAAIEHLDPTDSSALAHHYSACLSPDTARKALVHNISAAEQAARRFAHDGAIDFLERALTATEHLPDDDTPPPDQLVDLLTELSRTQLSAGMSSAGMLTRARALAVADRHDRRDLAARILAFVDTPTPWVNRRYGAVDRDTVAVAESLLDEDLDAPLRCRLLITLVHELGGEDATRTLAAARTAELLARDIGDPELLGLTLNALHCGTGSFRSLVTGDDIADEVLRIGEDHGLPVFTMLGHSLHAWQCAAAADLAAAEWHATRQSELADRYRWHQARGTAAMFRGLLAHMRGDLAGAEEHYLRGHELMDRAGLDADSILALATLTMWLTQGREGEFELVADTVDSDAPDVVTDLLALAQAANGRIDVARRTREAVLPVRRDFFHGLMLALRGIVVARVGSGAEAEAVYTELSARSGQVGGADTGAYAIGPVDTVLADLAEVAGRPGDAARHRTLAYEVARRCGCPQWIEAAERRLHQHS
ncbi:AAA family ATPase [Rhodococcus triatomae]|uniref:Transcriptional regulatory protein, C terminal n=1 Tax=Rhodococcus triatomae TaxID=300028 RepID=A0A1G8AMV0_9NOCA|nr:BTAD domain-containing putative transcriptional regulator [Rhodococcus triatomae]QNG17719.1 AAA family ATPase [Rhodococcus triatomae]QNG22614.1 AAA family ATPase [Rhodococcus triatomae]SDH22288.1 Transcriptional regulatory protein, C terminal [Rhodococcus triatomae]